MQYTLPQAQAGVHYSVTLSVPSEFPPGTTGTWAFSNTTNAIPAYTHTPQDPGLPYNWNGLILQTNGSIIGTPAAYGDFAIYLEFYGSNGQHATQAISLHVIPATLTLTGPPSASGSLRDTPAWQPSGWSGGYLPYQGITYSGLPAGLGWDANNGYRVTGWPTQAGTFSCRCIIIDQQGTQASYSFSLTIATPAPMTLAVTSLPAVGFRIPYSYQLACSSGTRGAANLIHYDVISGSLPSGLTLSYNGLLSGNTRTPGTYTLGIRITDTDGWTDSHNTITFVVTAAPNITLTNSNPPQGYEQLAYTFQLAATGGTGGGDGIYTYAALDAALPPGLAVASGGLLHGTPTLAGYYSMTIFVTDSQGVQAAISVPITIQLAYSKRDPYHNVFYQVLNSDGTAAYDASGALWTNDPNPSFGGKLTFAQVVVGYTIGTNQFRFTDVRERGGGLIPEAQTRPEAVHFWDTGYWDGKPEPIGGAMVVRLPKSKLQTMPRALLEAKLQEILPAGVLAVLRFYDETTGEESL